MLPILLTVAELVALLDGPEFVASALYEPVVSDDVACTVEVAVGVVPLVQRYYSNSSRSWMHWFWCPWRGTTPW